MRFNRLTIAGTAATAVVIAGCLSGTANGEPPDTSTCYDLGGAKDDLMLASKPETARKAADTLEKYSPPDAVKAAIEHFVTTVGAQPSDPTLDANRSSIASWLKQMCPMLNTY
ncbi:MAG: hypothetical protein QOK12_1235 [Mycobacterium sp.]|nr:hypothetical protein [Mycobacterium sp.]